MNPDDLLAQAKARLRIPELWRLLNLPGSPAKSCRSPWRDDHNPSFSVFDDGQRWRDFAADEGGDAIDFLARARGLSNSDACREFIKLAGITPPPPQHSTLNPQSSFDWPACVAALTPERRARLSAHTHRVTSSSAGVASGAGSEFGLKSNPAVARE